MNLTFGSVCSGIEAASVAWEPLGWRAAWVSEIEAFAAAVLAHRYPDVYNLGDMTGIAGLVRFGEVSAPDVLVGGTPCQSFSIAGMRAGMSDPRGGLTLSYVELADAIDRVRANQGHPPLIAVWENVPGVLSSKDNAFGCFLAALAGDGEPYPMPTDKRGGSVSWSDAGVVFGPKRAIAWRVVDAQYFGLAQRRRRVFVVASARPDFHPAQVLLEWDGVRRDTAPSREAEEGAAGGLGAGAADGGITGSLTARAGQNMGQANDDVDGNKLICMAHGQGGAEIREDSAPTLTCNHEAPIAAYCASGAGYWREGIGPLRGRAQDSHESICCVTGDITHTLKAEGFDASEDRTGRGQPIIAVHGTQDPDIRIDQAHTLGRNSGQENAVLALSCKDHGGDAGPISPTLRSMGHDGSHANAGGQVAVAIAFQERGRDGGRSLEIAGEVAYALTAPSGGGRAQERNVLTPTMQVRRLTPRECERLQGFPDDWTMIPWRKKPAEECPDGPRYKALGNSMAVNVMQWLGQRIEYGLRRPWR